MRDLPVKESPPKRSMAKASGINGNGQNLRLLLRSYGLLILLQPWIIVTSIWTYYVRVASKYYWIIDGKGNGARGSTSWMRRSSWCSGFLIELVEASCASITTMVPNSRNLMLAYRYSFSSIPIYYYQIALHWTLAMVEDALILSSQNQVLLLVTSGRNLQEQSLDQNL